MKKLVWVMMLISINLACTQSSDDSSNPRGDGNGGGSGSGNNGGGGVSGTWNIPVAKVLDGGPGKDGIPALTGPNMIDVDDVDFLNDTDLVIGYKNGNDVRAYTHIVMDWHEIVNDNIGETSLAITYCPLTGTGIGWNRIIDDEETTFGVSGLLYNTNLIPYDRATDSNWSQILGESVNGELLDKKADLIPLVETTWATWKTLYPNSQIISKNTGFDREYGKSPYGDYANNHDFFLFPVDVDPRLPSKQRVLALVGENKAKVYQHNPDTVTEDSFKEKNYLIVNGPTFMVAFEKGRDFDDLTFEYVYDGTSDVVLKDDENNEWNIFGEAVSGPMAGQKLGEAPYFMAYWFSIPAFYETEIYGQN